MSTLHADQIRALILKVLLAANGTPMTDAVLRDNIKRHFGFIPTLDLDTHIRGLETERYIDGTENPFLRQLVWVLTDAGTIQAKRLP
jgi:hypothetical protein